MRYFYDIFISSKFGKKLQKFGFIGVYTDTMRNWYIYSAPLCYAETDASDMRFVWIERGSLRHAVRIDRRGFDIEHAVVDFPYGQPRIEHPRERLNAAAV